MKYRYRIFTSIILTTQLFLWYYVTAFCAVYQESQQGWIQGCLISATIGLTAFEFGIPLATCFTKYLAIKCRSK